MSAGWRWRDFKSRTSRIQYISFSKALYLVLYKSLALCMLNQICGNSLMEYICRIYFPLNVKLEHDWSNKSAWYTYVSSLVSIKRQTKQNPNYDTLQHWLMYSSYNDELNDGHVCFLLKLKKNRHLKFEIVWSHLKQQIIGYFGQMYFGSVFLIYRRLQLHWCCK